jgi:hypothetical protein
MATPVLVATPGASNANSYCTVAESDTYHESHLYADDWTGASADRKIISLIMSTRLLDSKFAWAHFPTNSFESGQVLQWPRSGMIDVDGFGTIDSNVIPQRLKWATAEYARQLLVANRTADSDIETQGITSLSAGPISLSFKDSVKAKVVPDAVIALMPSWWGTVRGSSLTWQVLRG